MNETDIIDINENKNITITETTQSSIIDQNKDVGKNNESNISLDKGIDIDKDKDINKLNEINKQTIPEIVEKNENKSTNVENKNSETSNQEINVNNTDKDNTEDFEKLKLAKDEYLQSRSLSKKQSLKLQIDELSAQKIIEKNLESIQKKIDFDPNLYSDDRRVNTHVPTIHVKNININNTTYINNQEVKKNVEIKIDEEIINNNKATEKEKEKEKKKINDEQNKVNTSVSNQSIKNSKNRLIDYQRYMFKIILLGNIAVGKTCLLSYFVDNVFRTEYTCTVGVDFKVKTVSIEPDKKIDLQIWDTSGEERFKTITKQYYRDASGILIVFDVTNEKSFLDVANWIEDIKNYSKLNVSIVLVGNKCDLENQRVVSREKALEFANKNDLKYYETSAKTGTKVGSMFEELALIMVNKFDLEEAVKKQSMEDEKSNALKNTAFVVDDKSSKSRKKKKNCC